MIRARDGRAWCDRCGGYVWPEECRRSHENEDDNEPMGPSSEPSIPTPDQDAVPSTPPVADDERMRRRE